jgi:hypothetical protein
MSTPNEWTFQERENGYRRVAGPGVLFIRWRVGRPWEFYTLYQRGYWRDRERFYRMLTDAEAARLDAYFDRAQAAERLGWLRMDHVRDMAKRSTLSVPGCVYHCRPETSEL